MIDYASCNFLIKMLVALCIFIILLYDVYITVWLLEHSQRIRTFISGVLILPEYLLLQCIIGNISTHIEVPILEMMTNWIGGLPYLVFVVLIIVLSVFEGYIFVYKKNWMKNNITNMSVKYAVERLHVGVCAYYNDGQLVLVNTLMEDICENICGDKLINVKAFVEKVLPNVTQKNILHLNSGETYSFSSKVIIDDYKVINLVIAEDITEKYHQKEILTIQKDKAEEVNLRLREYNRDMVSVIATKERLNAKVKIHDSLGSNLLEIKNYLINGGSEATRQEILDNLNENIQFLRKESEPVIIDEYEAIMDTAIKLNLIINIINDLPSEANIKHIVATAMHECLTNTIRHAHGDTLNAETTYVNDSYTIVFTNNGNPPEHGIIEKGGLASLRKLVEANHGSMTTEIDGGFKLTLVLPKETNYNDL